MSQDSKVSPPLTLNLNLTVNLPGDAFKRGDVTGEPSSQQAAVATNLDQFAKKPAKDFEGRAKDAFDISKGDKASSARGLLVREFRRVKGECISMQNPTRSTDMGKGERR